MSEPKSKSSTTPATTEWLKTLLQLADRASDLTPTITIRQADIQSARAGVFEITVNDGPTILGATLDIAIANAAIRLVEALNIRAEGDKEAMELAASDVVAMRSLVVKEDPRQLKLL